MSSLRGGYCSYKATFSLQLATCFNTVRYPFLKTKMKLSLLVIILLPQLWRAHVLVRKQTSIRLELLLWNQDQFVDRKRKYYDALAHRWIITPLYPYQEGCFRQVSMYSQICIKRSPLGPRKSGLIRQVTSLKRFNSYNIFYDRTRKR